MGMKIGCAPCCWGVDDVKNPYLPNWKLAFFAACGRVVMCPIGKGVIDYQRVRQALLDIGYITVEQERDPRNAGSSLADLTSSRNFLQSKGFH